MKNNWIVPALALGLLSACTGNQNSIPPVVPEPTNTLTPIPSATLELSSTPIPTSTVTLTPTPDYSAIYYKSMYFIGQNQTVITFNLGDVQGEYRAVADGKEYACQAMADQPGTLFCYGPLLGSGKEILLELYVADRNDPIESLGIIVPSMIAPTPYGMQCEAEPLWVGFGGGYGCYAITCYVNGAYYGGTDDSCVTPWLWPWP